MGLQILIQTVVKSLGLDADKIGASIEQVQKLIPVAVQAIQEMNERSKRMEAKLDALLHSEVCSRNG